MFSFKTGAQLQNGPPIAKNRVLPVSGYFIYLKMLFQFKVTKCLYSYFSQALEFYLFLFHVVLSLLLKTVYRRLLTNFLIMSTHNLNVKLNFKFLLQHFLIFRQEKLFHKKKELLERRNNFNDFNDMIMDYSYIEFPYRKKA